jgi:hypothetical protein
MELLDLPLYAVQRLADGTWLVRTQMGDPILPPTTGETFEEDRAWKNRPA